LLPGGRPRRFICDIQAGGRPRRLPRPRINRSSAMIASSTCSRSWRNSASIFVMSIPECTARYGCFGFTSTSLSGPPEKRVRRECWAKAGVNQMDDFIITGAIAQGGKKRGPALHVGPRRAIPESLGRSRGIVRFKSADYEFDDRHRATQPEPICDSALVQDLGDQCEPLDPATHIQR
jgi:hypothetical protein